MATKTKPKLTAGDKAIRDLARAIVVKTVRLRNKADLVACDPRPGRNLTALRTTADEMLELLGEITARRCWRCGCTDEHGCDEGCEWVSAALCSACAGKETP